MLKYQDTLLSVDDTRETSLEERKELLRDIHDVADFLQIDEEAVQQLIERAAVETISPPERVKQQVVYPEWPTSKPGPRETLPPLDQQPVSTRTDQMTYECYDQEQGMVCPVLPEAAPLDKATKKWEKAPERPDMLPLIDISGVSQLGKYPLTPAEMGHYHYGPYSPGINTDASGSYAPHEIDPRGRAVDRPVKLYVTGKRLSRRTT